MADNRIYQQYQPILPLNKPQSGQSSSANTARPNAGTFDQILQNELSGVKFSQHAMQRLQSRNIKLDQTELAKLNTAVEKASQKGARESLILMNSNLALVVSVKNKMVITAMDGANLKDNVFTNIDSAVIV